MQSNYGYKFQQMELLLNKWKKGIGDEHDILYEALNILREIDKEKFQKYIVDTHIEDLPDHEAIEKIEICYRSFKKEFFS